jgi:PPOX class probable F420-dependent enzyme
VDAPSRLTHVPDPTDRTDLAREQLLRSRSRGVLVTVKSDGRPQLSVVDYTVDGTAPRIRISTTDGRSKVRNLRRDPRASFHVASPDMGAWLVAEGVVELSAVAADDHDATVEELIDVYRAIQGEHPDWDDYRAAMVADHRLVMRLLVERTYGQAPPA